MSWHHPDGWTDASFLGAVFVLVVLFFAFVSSIVDGSAWAWLMSIRLPAGW